MARLMDDILAMPYSRRIRKQIEDDGDTYWLAWIEEIECCMTHGDTYAEAMAMLDDCFKNCISVMVEDGVDVPPPNRYSVKPDRRKLRQENNIESIAKFGSESTRSAIVGSSSEYVANFR